MPDRASLDSTFGLNETQILMRLVTWDRIAREQIRGIAMCGHQPVKLSSVSAIVRGLRKKLAKHKIELTTIHGFGWGLSPEGRAKVLELLTDHRQQTDPGRRYGGRWRKNLSADRVEPEKRQNHSATA